MIPRWCYLKSEWLHIPHGFHLSDQYPKCQVSSILTLWQKFSCIFNRIIFCSRMVQQSFFSILPNAWARLIGFSWRHCMVFLFRFRNGYHIAQSNYHHISFCSKMLGQKYVNPGFEAATFLFTVWMLLFLRSDWSCWWWNLSESKLLFHVTQVSLIIRWYVRLYMSLLAQTH